MRPATKLRGKPHTGARPTMSRRSGKPLKNRPKKPSTSPAVNHSGCSIGKAKHPKTLIGIRPLGKPAISRRMLSCNMFVAQPLPIDHAVGRAALRKASFRLIPLFALGYGIAYMDRVNISFASLQMNRDLHFSASIYGLGAGLFFLSYAACEIPSNLLLCRFGARRWLARIMFTWGLLAISMLFVRTPRQFYTLRFFLGMAEAGFFPGTLFYIMQCFPPNLRARTISRYYISLPLAAVLMGLVAGPILNLNGRLGLAGWQWL